MPRASMETETKRIAMLIDGDNAEAPLLEKMIAEAGKYGQVTIRRIYGDWTTTSMNSWKKVLNDHAIQPIQQFRNTVGKNATDSAMIIDAMDILYEGVVNGFCVVSSDSDYTRLATRIREKGFFVMGIGHRTTPKAFVNACEVFVFTENLQPQKPVAPKPSPRQPAQPAVRVETRGEAPEGLPFDPLPLMINAVDMSAQEDGWAPLANIGNRLIQLDPSFDTRTYGYKQLSQLIKAYPDEFEVKREKGPGGPPQVYIRLKDKRV